MKLPWLCLAIFSFFLWKDDFKAFICTSHCICESGCVSFLAVAGNWWADEAVSEWVFVLFFSTHTSIVTAIINVQAVVCVFTCTSLCATYNCERACLAQCVYDCIFCVWQSRQSWSVSVLKALSQLTYIRWKQLDQWPAGTAKELCSNYLCS